MNFFRPIRRMLAAAALTLAATAPAQAANTAFSGAAVSGCSYASASQTYTCTSLPLPNYNDTISIPSGYTVVVNSAVSFGYNQGLTMSGTASLQTSGDLDISGINPSNLAVSGGTLSTNGAFSVGAQAQTITANISAASMNIGTGSATKITGSLTSTGTVAISSNVTIIGPISGTTITTNSPVSLTGNVTASTAFTLASGSSLVGNITAPTVTLNPSSVTVKGNIAAATSLSIGSGNSVNGSVSGGALTLSPSSASIIGNVTMTGDVDLGSGDNITGNLTAHNVTTESSNAYISGNAAVNSLTLGYGGYVGGTVTCTASGASGCSCVNNTNSGRAAPTCSAAAPAGPDHILITQSGSGLTCQASTVTLTACANSACSSNYSGNVTGTMQPGGQSFTINGTGSATVQQSASGPATLSATSTATNPSLCKDTADGSNSCVMTFSDAGLLLSVPNHLSDSSAALTLKAVQKNTATQTCAPMFAGTTQTFNFTCGYSNPSSGTVPVRINSTSAAGVVTSVPLAGDASSACTAGGAKVGLKFDNTGAASTPLQYADVGQMSLNASYVPPSGNTPVLQGGTSFIAAPASFGFTITQVAAPKTLNPNDLVSPFIRTGDPFQVVLSALNSSGKVTPNFGAESTAESYTLATPVLLLPTTCSAASPPANCIAPPVVGNFGPIKLGVATASSMTWGEVGVFGWTATLANTSGYLGAGGGFITTGTVKVGRFVPDHFETTVTPVKGVPMACTYTTGSSTTTVISGCPANQAVYSNQPFAVQVTAKGPPSNNVSSTMVNYHNEVAELVTYTGWDGAGAFDLAGAKTTHQRISSPNPPGTLGSIVASQFAAGVASTTAAAPLQYNFSSIDPSKTSLLTAPTAVYLRALDVDLANMAVITPGVGASSTEPGLMVVSGALLVSNNYGSEMSPTPVTLKARYWNGSAYTNSTTDNNQTGYALSNSGISFTNCTQHLATGATAGVGQPNCSAALKLKATSTPTTSTLLFNNGLSTFLLTAPGSGNSGAADITINDSVAPFVIPFLPSVSGRATFGVYRGGPVIYLREVY